jgi:preprotein translocase subunit SecA
MSSDYLSEKIRTQALAEQPDRELLLAIADHVDGVFCDRDRLRLVVESLTAENQRLRATEGVW